VHKIGSSFTSTGTPHGGQETTIVNLNTTFYHSGAIIVGREYADPIQFRAGNPYGASFTSNNGLSSRTRWRWPRAVPRQAHSQKWLRSSQLGAGNQRFFHAVRGK
jgi:multimeric flavodoxin WrbA